jgi:UDPglucose 6-dehydrogenase
MKIGFIGQGWIGKNYADDFENRNYEVVRYGLEEELKGNKEKIKECDIVFVAVPTPTTPEGFNDEAVVDSLKHVGQGNIAVIKSTILPGTTEKLQKIYPDIYIFHSPEFLAERTAAYDAANPTRNIIGTPVDSNDYKERAQKVLDVLPEAPYKKIMSARDAELVKYAANSLLVSKILFMNLVYDLVEHNNGNWENVREGVANDPRIGHSHTHPLHTSGHLEESEKIQRGAGGHCFIKDFEAFRTKYKELSDESGTALLDAFIAKNIQLLLESEKDLDILEGVYGQLDKFKT